MANLRDELLDLIDRKAFEPVLNASADDYDSEADRRKLADVQSTTKSTRERYYGHDDASGVRGEFKNDLSSDAAENVQRELRSLGLPTLQDVEDDVNRAWREAQQQG